MTNNWTKYGVHEALKKKTRISKSKFIDIILYVKFIAQQFLSKRQTGSQYYY